ncbi:hypothetical protein [Gimesia algae]|uniref:Uncharacterized protein n=1 Tax=Gimesia algae TaxID=2527971 RepID=A0A517VJY6_9PLAN|nr:hypothetical protein [Gimesia algae]QDT93341.1 hypothetical protein Pan161_50200 [Gimesia algae]
MNYSESDLQPLPDHVEFVRSRPEMFLPYGHASNGSLLGVMVDQIVTITGARTAAFRIDEWWGIACVTDWIPETNQKALSDYFQSMTACPEWAVNSVRFEIVLYAFTEDLTTITQRESTLIKGTMPDMEIITKAKQIGDNWRRMLLFR